jgi:Fic family protein
VKLLSVAGIAKKWGLSERTVRNYCTGGKIPGAFLTGKKWNIPESSIPPPRSNAKKYSDNPLLNILKEEKDAKIKGGIYHRVQVDLTYNSNHMEGSRLTHEQTRFIFETNTIGVSDEDVKIDEVIETCNHFRCIEYIIDNAKKPLSENMIKELHRKFKTGTVDNQLLKHFAVIGH